MITCAMDEYLGAYALGALDDDEECAIRSHLAGCARCAAELASLTGTVSLLGLLSRQDVQRALGAPAPPATPSARPPARWRRGALAVLGSLLVAGTVGGSAALVAHESPPAVTTTASDPASDVAATLTIAGEDAGTALHLSLRGVYPGGWCSLVVHGRDGRSETVATWLADADGTADVRATTSLPPDDVRHVDVVTASGQQLVRLVPPAPGG